MLAVVTALLVSAAAAGLILYSWRSNQAGGLVASAGWLAAFASALIWSSALGPEVGVTYSIIVFVCLVWVEIGFMMEVRRPLPEAARRPFQKLYHPRSRDFLKHGALFLLSVPTTAAIAMMSSVALVLHTSWSIPVKFAVAIFLYPLLWGALSAWICAQTTLRKPILVSIALLMFSSLLLAIPT